VSSFPYSEAGIAKAIGFPRGHVRHVRLVYLKKDEHWQKNGGGEVLFSDAGLDAVLKRDGIARSEVDIAVCLAAEKKAQEPNRREKMIVTKIPFNPRMVLARFPDEEEEQLVDVGRNRTLAIGDEIEVGPHETAQEIYQLLSPLPRDRRRPYWR